MALDPFTAMMRRLGRRSVVAGGLAMVLAVAIAVTGLEHEGALAPVLVVGLALAILFAVLLGTARLMFGGREGRTWSGILLAMGAGGIATLAGAPEWFGTVFPIQVAVLHTIANLVTTARILRSDDLDASRRRWQIGLVWGVPALGVILLYAFYSAQDDPWRRDGYCSTESGAGMIG